MLVAQVQPVSHLKRHATSIANELADAGEPVSIAQRREARLVGVDMHAHLSQQQTLALRMLVSRAPRDIAARHMRNTGAAFTELEKDGAA